MNTEKIIISIYFLTVCGSFTFASSPLDEEFNPVDVINEYFAGGSANSAQQQLSPQLASPQTSLIPAMELPKEIVELFIPANLAGSPAQSKFPAGELNRKLWETTIAAADENDETNKANLLQMIEKIKSLKFAKSQSNQSAAAPEEKPQPLTTEIAEEEAAPPEPEKIQAAPVVEAEKTIDSNEKLTSDALAKIENNPDGIKNPYELAEILYRGGHLQQAAICYKQTLKTGMFENQPETKSWVLFQLGNCFKESQPDEAMKIYARLLTEHPDSTWAKAAKRYNELLNLQLQDKPYELIKEQTKDLQEKKSDEQF